MNFKDKLNNYIDLIGITSKDLSKESNISESVISRYRSGDRTPKIGSTQLKNIADALYKFSKLNKVKELENIDFYSELSNVILKKEHFNHENFNYLINILKININDISKYTNFDASHISRIRYGKTNPSDPITFIDNVARYIDLKYNTKENIINLKTLINNDIDNNNLINYIKDFLLREKEIEITDEINNFLNYLNDFELNDYIKSIKFDELKVPSIPFYKPKSRMYYGLEEMKKGELDFFKATILSKSTSEIFMYSNMPMEDMAKDIEFGKKWMFAIAVSLKKGLHLNIIHNLDRPFNEMMLGLISWIPIYMTGQVSPFYYKDQNNSIINTLTYTSSVCSLSGESIKGHHDKGKYYLATSKGEVKYYKEKSELMLKKATPLMEIYTTDNKNNFNVFLLKDKDVLGNRTRTLNSLPLFTISNNLLIRILKNNNINEEDIKLIKEYKKKEEKYISNILNNKIVTDIINFDYSIDKYLSLENIFYDKKIKYTKEEYNEHLELTKKYNNKNYKVLRSENNTFNNISITSVDNNYVIISKNSNPVIHFIIRHPKLMNSIINFKNII